MIDWFDVVPPDAYEEGSWPRKLTIHPVSLQHANGAYRDPEWSNGDNLSQDWINFVARVIERSRKTATAPKPTGSRRRSHVLEHEKKTFFS